MAILAGIDEAGFGPVVGPLVVSLCVLRVPEEMANQCLWRRLSGCVTRRAFRKSPAMPIADSKLLHVRSDGVIHLERGVLGMLHQLGHAPRELALLLELLCPHVIAETAGYPWYAQPHLPLPRQADAQDVLLRANAVSAAMKKHRIELLSMKAEPVLEGRYNKLLAATRNKSVTSFTYVSKLIVDALGFGQAGEPVRIVVDRQGGRMRYLEHLEKMFEGGRFKIMEESEAKSAYLIAHQGQQIEVSFLVQGEAACLAVALASMISKYVRELFMELLNGYWAKLVPDLKPTAGYYADGRRFVKDVSAALIKSGIDRALLVRAW